jgi:hypothetical protein
MRNALACKNASARMGASVVTRPHLAQERVREFLIEHTSNGELVHVRIKIILLVRKNNFGLFWRPLAQIKKSSVVRKGGIPGLFGIYTFWYIYQVYIPQGLYTRYTQHWFFFVAPQTRPRQKSTKLFLRTSKITGSNFFVLGPKRKKASSRQPPTPRAPGPAHRRTGRGCAARQGAAVANRRK